MEITRDMLHELAWEDWDTRAKWLRLWIKIAEDEVKKEQPWPPLYDLLSQSVMEHRHRRECLEALLPALFDAGEGGAAIEIEGLKMMLALSKRLEKCLEERRQEEKPREP